ncbi:NAC domain-containing protein 2-like [Miscanthus floridulus]|uniref:NAC domain-containing protein 2-like n=1 Tax=Miscanthus floridulus TaxID=154761 RepID=UPI00345B104C
MCSTPIMSSSAPPVCSPAKLELNLPPGYHFLPTDDELVVHYLRPRLANANHHLPLPIFVHERILNYHPDKLIEKYRNYGEGRWFFFTDRERKHLGGNRPNRTTPDNGHWNATGSIRPIRSAGGVLVGCRRTLVFYEASRSRKKKSQAGLPPTEEEEGEGDGGQQAAKAKDGVKTEWTMYEYESLTSEAEFEAIRSGNANKMDELVLCTIQKKKHSQEGGERKKSTKRKTKEEGLELEHVSTAAAGSDVEQGGRMAAPLGGGSITDHHMSENRIVNVMSAVEAHTFTGFFPSISNSNYSHLSTRMDHPVPSSVSFPSQQSHGAGSRTVMQGPLLNNQVNLNHQNSAAAPSTVGYDQRNGVGLPKIV